MSRIRARAARLTARRSALVVVGVVVGALFVPHGAAVAQKALQEVIVANGIDNPVPTRDRELAENSNVNPIHTREPKLAENSNTNPLHTREPKLAENRSTNPLYTRVTNPEGDPVNVRATDPTGTFTGKAYVVIADGQRVASGKVSIPDGKDLVVEHASCRTYLTRDAGKLLYVDVVDQDDGLGAYLPAEGGAAASEQLNIRLKGSAVHFVAWRAATTGSLGVPCFVNGYLVDE